ncbi:hypothetical protein LguiB_009382 [Lonicera macranthoides]
MSNLPPNYPHTNLHCDEAINDAIYPTDDILHDFDHACLTNPVEDGQSSPILNMFNSELNQVSLFESPTSFQNFSEVVDDRRDAIKWMFKVNEHYNFGAHTAYLSVKYQDRFLLSRAPLKRKGWPWQLLSVACLSLAAKLEETRVPSLLDLQILMEPFGRFMFKPATVQRMELLVMSSLNWRMHIITPFNFLDHFIAKLLYSCFESPFDDLQFTQISSRATDLILSSAALIESMDYTPSAIAAAAAICASGLKINYQKSACIHERLSNEMVNKCCHLFNHRLIKTHVPAKIRPISPLRLLDMASNGSSENETRKKLK